jgi:hypothetical protein
LPSPFGRKNQTNLAQTLQQHTEAFSFSIISPAVCSKFPKSVTVVPSNTISINKLSAGVLKFVRSKVGSYKRPCDLQYLTNYVGGNLNQNSRSILTGN